MIPLLDFLFIIGCSAVLGLWRWLTGTLPPDAFD